MERTLDRYRILGELGRGGMGVVYRARDTVLDRVVALKMLPADRVADPERRRRFLQEARAASALNHPGIVTVHDLQSVEGSDFIVMELVDGQTLEEKLARGPFGLGQAVRVAVQVADALARAHGAGIVHRDLKPSNVMLTKEGTAKILDFGLAKLVDVSSPDTAAPTLGMKARGDSATEDGALVGTVPYMSPEQTMGKPVDSRTDVFSFGVLLYEMTTGRHPFRRPMLVETLSAIRTAEPVPPTTLSPGLPVEIERLILRCLQKEPSDRWQSMADLKAVLQDFEHDSGSGRRGPAALPALPRSGRRWALVAAVALLLLAASGVVLLLRTGRPPGGLLEIRRLTYDTGLTFSSSLASSGTLAVYSSDRGGDGALSLWLQHVAQKNPVRVTSGDWDAWQPSFSPDGSRIVFRSERDDGGVEIVSALGGEVKRLAPLGAFPKFSPDGKLVAYFEDPAFAPAGLRRIFVVPADGGEARQVAPGYGTYGMPGSLGPVWSPDGRRLLFKGAPLATPEKQDWWVADLDGGPVVSTGAGRALTPKGMVQAPAAWLEGSLVFISGTTIEGLNIFRARISPEGTVSGPEEAWTSGPGMTIEVGVASNGLMAFSRFNWVVNLWEVALDPATGRPAGEPRKLTNDGAPKFGFSLSRDGVRLAYSTFAGTAGKWRNEIHVVDRATGRESVPVEGPTTRVSLRPRLSRDGNLLAWTDQVEGKPAVFLAKPVDGARRELCRGCSLDVFLADGKRALARLPNGRLALLSLADGSLSPLAGAETGPVLDADVSPDDGWIAVASGRVDGRVEIAVRRLEPDEAPRTIQVATSPTYLGQPRWSHDGKLLYYLSHRDGRICVWAQPLDSATKSPAGEPFAVVHAHGKPVRSWGPREAFSVAVGRDRLVFNAADGRGDIYLADLPRR